MESPEQSLQKIIDDLQTRLALSLQQKAELEKHLRSITWKAEMLKKLLMELVDSNHSNPDNAVLVTQELVQQLQQLTDQ